MSIKVLSKGGVAEGASLNAASVEYVCPAYPHISFNSLDVPITREYSIVAIHGLDEANLETWTDPKTDILWLRDLFPHEQLNARVLAYGYNAESLRSSRDSTAV